MKKPDNEQQNEDILHSMTGAVIKYAPLFAGVLLAAQLCAQGCYPLLCTVGDTLRPEAQIRPLTYGCYTLALYSARMQFPKNDVRIAELLCDLAGIDVLATRTGDADRAIANDRAALNIFTAMFGVNNPGSNHCLVALAAACKSKSDSANELRYETRALKTCQEMYGDTHVAVANKLEDIANLHRDNFNLDMAVEYHNQSLHVRQKLWGEDSRYTVQDLIEVADTYSKLGAGSRALQLYRKALDIVRKQPDRGADQAKIQQKIANWYYAHHDFDQALTWYSKELAGHQHAGDESLWQHYEPLDRELVGRCLVKLGQYSRAVKEFKEAERLYRQMYGRRSEIVARVEQWLAKAYEGLGEDKKAEGAYDDAIRLYDDIARGDQEVVTIYESDGYDAQTARYAQANLLVRLGKADSLIERLHKVLKQEEDEAFRSQTLQLLYTVQARAGQWKNASETHERYLDSLIALREDKHSGKDIADFRGLRSTGETRMVKQDLYGAIDALSKAARLGDQLSQLDDRELCQVLSTLASAEMRAEKFKAADQHLEEARKLAEQEYQRTHGRADSATTLANVEWGIAADYLMTMGRCSESLPHYRKALQILRKLDAHRQDLFICLHDYAACLRITGDVKAAQAAEIEAQALDQEADYDIHRAGECIAMHSGEATFRLPPSKSALDSILLGPVNLTEALYTKTLGDDARARGQLGAARAAYTRALEYMKVLGLEQTLYAAPIKRDLTALPSPASPGSRDSQD